MASRAKVREYHHKSIARDDLKSQRKCKIKRRSNKHSKDVRNKHHRNSKKYQKPPKSVSFAVPRSYPTSNDFRKLPESVLNGLYQQLCRRIVLKNENTKKKSLRKAQENEDTKKFEIFVNLYGARTITVETSSNEKVQIIKQKIEKKSGITPLNQRLVFGTKTLENFKELREYKIIKDSKIHLAQKVNGGSGGAGGNGGGSATNNEDKDNEKPQHACRVLVYLATELIEMAYSELVYILNRPRNERVILDPTTITVIIDELARRDEEYDNGKRGPYYEDIKCNAKKIYRSPRQSSMTSKEYNSYHSTSPFHSSFLSYEPDDIVSASSSMRHTVSVDLSPLKSLARDNEEVSSIMGLNDSLSEITMNETINQAAPPQLQPTRSNRKSLAERIFDNSDQNLPKMNCVVHGIQDNPFSCPDCNSATCVLCAKNCTTCYQFVCSTCRHYHVIHKCVDDNNQMIRVRFRDMMQEIGSKRKFSDLNNVIQSDPIIKRPVLFDQNYLSESLPFDEQSDEDNSDEIVVNNLTNMPLTETSKVYRLISTNSRHVGKDIQINIDRTFVVREYDNLNNSNDEQRFLIINEEWISNTTGYFHFDSEGNFMTFTCTKAGLTKVNSKLLALDERTTLNHNDKIQFGITIFLYLEQQTKSFTSTASIKQMVEEEIEEEQEKEIEKDDEEDEASEDEIYYEDGTMEDLPGHLLKKNGEIKTVQCPSCKKFMTMYAWTYKMHDVVCEGVPKYYAYGSHIDLVNTLHEPAMKKGEIFDMIKQEYDAVEDTVRNNPKSLFKRGTHKHLNLEVLKRSKKKAAVYMHGSVDPCGTEWFTEETASKTYRSIVASSKTYSSHRKVKYVNELPLILQTMKSNVNELEDDQIKGNATALQRFAYVGEHKLTEGKSVMNCMIERQATNSNQFLQCIHLKFIPPLLSWMSYNMNFPKFKAHENSTWRDYIKDIINEKSIETIFGLDDFPYDFVRLIETACMIVLYKPFLANVIYDWTFVGKCMNVDIMIKIGVEVIKYLLQNGQHLFWGPLEFVGQGPGAIRGQIRSNIVHLNGLNLDEFANIGIKFDSKIKDTLILFEPGNPLHHLVKQKNPTVSSKEKQIYGASETCHVEQQIQVQQQKIKPRIKVLGKTTVTPEAENAINAFIQATVSAGVEGIRNQFTDVKSYASTDSTHEKFTANPERNRYQDIICLDSTRVVLNLNVPPDVDYIHANWVKMDSVDRKFIATQGPLDNTIGDFWRMVFQENVTVILMLCKCEEDGKAKCVQYWPPESGGYKTYQGMFINNKRVEKEDRFCAYTLEVLPEGCSNSNIVKLIQVIDWPDKGVPSSGMSILRLLKMISTGSLSIGPAIVHCSAGVGRTGTLIAIETAIQRLWKGQTINFRDIVQQMRNQRALLMQTEHQYIFAHLSVMYYISAKIPKHREAVMTFHEQYKNSFQ